MWALTKPSQPSAVGRQPSDARESPAVARRRPARHGCLARRRPTLIARAAGESFIGSVVRRTPSKASSADATAAAVGTRPISPTPLAPNGPSGSGSSTRITSTARHVARAQHAELAELERHRHPVRARQLLGEGVAQAHVDRRPRSGPRRAAGSPPARRRAPRRRARPARRRRGCTTCVA